MKRVTLFGELTGESGEHNDSSTERGSQSSGRTSFQSENHTPQSIRPPNNYENRFSLSMLSPFQKDNYVPEPIAPPNKHKKNENKSTKYQTEMNCPPANNRFTEQSSLSAYSTSRPLILSSTDSSPLSMNYSYDSSILAPFFKSNDSKQISQPTTNFTSGLEISPTDKNEGSTTEQNSKPSTSSMFQSGISYFTDKAAYSSTKVSSQSSTSNIKHQFYQPPTNHTTQTRIPMYSSVPAFNNYIRHNFSASAVNGNVPFGSSASALYSSNHRNSSVPIFDVARNSGLFLSARNGPTSNGSSVFTPHATIPCNWSSSSAHNGPTSNGSSAFTPHATIPCNWSPSSAVNGALSSAWCDPSNENDGVINSFDGEPRGKKSQNTTECVPVPSSEHVAEIVGRQGCKIKALRAKTNTYIKTPVRGEEPVFVVTGRKEDVNSAKREILSAAEHFSQIRAQRKNNLNGSVIPGPNSNIPGQTTIQVRVPYRVVGLVVGPKGATIKRIQQQTNTYIVTPSRDKEPIFEVTGLPDNVDSARKEIEAHIAMRTGGAVDGIDDDYNGNMESLTNNLNAINNSIYKNDITNNFICPFTRDSNNLLDLQTGDNAFNFPLSSRSTKQNDMFNFNIFSGFGGFYDSDDGLGDSPTYEAPSASASGSSWPDFSSTLTDSSPSLFGSNSVSDSSNGLSDMSQRSNSISGGITDLIIGEHPPARRIRSDPLNVPEVGDLLGNLGNLSLGNTISSFSPLGSSVTSSTAPASLTSVFPAAANKCTSSSSSSPVEAAPKQTMKRDWGVCFESPVVAALVPCGHNLFCLECGNRICEAGELAECPICRQRPTQAIRIYN